MGDTRKVVRAFLASPGDLQPERLAVRDVVQEFNNLWADQTGFQIELMGWEDTVSGYGRPQAIINQDLDRCDLFIGVMWKRWGTPPDNDGQYTSGFHEEFDRCVQRREESGRPEISLFFKDIPDDLLADPGKDLQRVLEFKNEIITARVVLFRNFADTSEIGLLARKRITRYVQSLKNDEHDETEVVEGEKRPRAIEPDRPTSEPQERSPFADVGIDFLPDLVERLRDKDQVGEIGACDVARFRLLSNSIKRDGNDEPNVGPHDLNILFRDRANLALARVEIAHLTRLGFRNLHQENVPLWHWYALSWGPSLAEACSWLGDTNDEKTGALRVLKLLKFNLSEIGHPDKHIIIPKWFSEDASDQLRNEAIQYLTTQGTEHELKYILEECERNSSNTARSALEGLISLRCRVSGRKEAAIEVLHLQFDSISAQVLENGLRGIDRLDVDDLEIGTKHRNADVRLRVLRRLGELGALTEDHLHTALEDDDANVRLFALFEYISRGRTYSDSEAKRVLVRPRQRGAFTLLSSPFSGDIQGEKAYDRYKEKRLTELSRKALKQKADDALVLDDDAYFVMAEKYFSSFASELRSNVDDRFGGYFAERLSRLERLNVDAKISDTVTKTRNLEDQVRKDLTRRGLDILGRESEANDIERIRGNLRDGYAGASKHDAHYLARHGNWQDIELLAKIEPPRLGNALLGMNSADSFDNDIGDAIYRIGRKDINRLLSHQIPPRLLHRILQICAESVFTNISDDLLLGMLNDASDGLRKAASLMAVRSLPVRRITKLLDEYVRSGEYRYYNSIHWLDIGASMPRTVSRNVARESS